MEIDMHTLALLQNIGPWEWIIIGIFALLLFGKRLPEVGRSLGKGIIEFKKGIRGIEDEIDSSSRDLHKPYEPPRSSNNPQPDVTKFEPPSSPPTPPSGAEGQFGST